MDVMKELNNLSIRKPNTKEKDQALQSVRLGVDWEQINQYDDPNEDVDTANGQCCCGEYNCKDEYVHWTSGY